MQSLTISGKRRLSPVLLLVAAIVALVSCLAAAAPEPCTLSGGVAIKMNGNHGFCYLVGRRMRKGSVFGQCKNGELTCYADEGIPDKPRQEVDCVAPEAGNCGSVASNATVGTPTPAATANASASEVVAGDVEFTERARSIDEVNDLNPSALVSGNIEVPELDDDDDDDDA